MRTTLALLVIVCACRPASQKADNDAPARPQAAADSVPAAPEIAPTPRPQGSHPTATDSQRAHQQGVQGHPDSALTPTIRELLASGALVGHRVRVTGRCLGYGRAAAVGGPPRTRSDWQLEGAGVAIYVTGQRPLACSATEGSTEATTILAIVAEDTLAARGDRPAVPRRYLIRVLQ